MSEWDNVPIVEVPATITLTKKEVEEARDERMNRLRCNKFLTEHSLGCFASVIHDPECALCLKLAQFVKGGRR